jgi:Dihydrouridine synthase (Dus)
MRDENRHSVISTESPVSVAMTRDPALGIGQDFSAITETDRIRNDRYKNLDGFMIGRASFGNPWSFLPGDYEPTFEEILSTMEMHGKLLWQWKERKGMMEARKHLVQYLHGFPGVKEYRSELVHVENVDDIMKVIASIRSAHAPLLGQKISSYNPESAMAVW